MKTHTLITLGLAIILFGCNSHKLDKATAKQLIQEEKEYPHVLNYDVFCSDPVHAKRMLNAGLEEKGLVVVDRTQKLKDIGNPLIHFTDKAKPYFLPTPEKDKASDIQKVKLASEVLAGIRDIKISDDHKRAIVEYTTSYEEITPFSTLLRNGLKEGKSHKAYFLFSNDEWHIAKKPDIKFLKRAFSH